MPGIFSPPKAAGFRSTHLSSFILGKRSTVRRLHFLNAEAENAQKFSPFSFSENGNFFPRPSPFPPPRFTLLYSCAGTKTAGGGNAAL